jgi:pimeloyl-ACP methyl ester carboxylesterase
VRRHARLVDGSEQPSNPAQMPTARHGDVVLFFEAFGSGTDPTLLLINGLGSQCINYDEQWCEKFAAQGYWVIRFDNRDVGWSSKLDERAYALRDMAADAVAVLDATNGERAHVMGVSMGGMIAQRLAIDHGDRLLSLTSVMSSTGEPEYGQGSPEALAAVMAKPARTRDEYVDNQIAERRIYGSKPEWIDEPYLRVRAARAFDRCYYPDGIRRQMQAIVRDGDRVDGLRSLTVPTLVMHGDRDTLVDPSGGRRTAELIPDARFVEIEGMGHDYPAAVWDRWVKTWADFVRSAVERGPRGR